jgi:thiamine kinase-like enzyme
MLEDVRRLSRRIAPFRPVLCHNDLMPANLIDDGQRLWLVDWAVSDNPKNGRSRSIMATSQKAT